MYQLYLKAPAWTLRKGQQTLSDSKTPTVSESASMNTEEAPANTLRFEDTNCIWKRQHQHWGSANINTEEAPASTLRKRQHQHKEQPLWETRIERAVTSLRADFSTFSAMNGDIIFRVAIFVKIWVIFIKIGTLIKNVIPYSRYLSPKTLKSAFWFSGFPKKACQGCHIFWNPG